MSGSISEEHELTIELPDVLQVSAGMLVALADTLRASLLVCIFNVAVLCRL